MMLPGKNLMVSRRNFLSNGAGVSAAVVLTALGKEGQAAEKVSSPQAAGLEKSGSDVGNLFPIIERQAVSGEFPLSYLNPKFRSLKRWKARARGKLLELLHYSPEKCAHEAEVVERVDKGDFVREKIYFNTAPGIRVPAYLLIPKNREKPLPALVALHDHGGFY